MLKTTYCLVVGIGLVSSGLAWGHGPQIQTTVIDQKISTRELIPDGPYSDSLTPAKSVYVMPLLDFDGVWYPRPNGELNALNLPAFYSGPGYAYGYDLADGGPQAFAEGSVLSLLVTSLKSWNGSSFVDAGATEAEAFRGSNTAPTAVAKSSDVGTASLPVATIAAGYGTEQQESHSTVRYRLLGDGTSPLVPPADGVYLLTLQLSSSDTSLAASDPFYFVLDKNTDPAIVQAAVAGLGQDPASVQYIPEPSAAGLWLAGGTLLAAFRRRATQR